MLQMIIYANFIYNLFLNTVRIIYKDDLFQYNDKFRIQELSHMSPMIIQKIRQVCNEKISKKGENVGLSFYAFFANKNDDPETLMQVATWWIQTHQLDHFEKAVKIKKMIEDEYGK